MPFTLAHPAVALPLYTRWRRGFLAFAIGSVGPDIPYFLPGRMGDALPSSHTALGAITVGAPLALLALVLAVLLRSWIVEPLWGRLRSSVRNVLLYVRRTPAAWIAAVPAVIAGSEIHVAWDSFTHKTGWVVRRVPALSANISPVDHHPFELFRALQYGSSLVGLLILAVWCRRRLSEFPNASGRPPGWRPWALAALVLASLVGAIFVATRASARYASFHGIEFLAATTALSTFAALYLTLGASIAFAHTSAKGAHAGD